MSKHAESGLRKNRARLLTNASVRAAAVALTAGLLLPLGCNVAIGGGVLAAGVVAGILTYDCAEGVGVTLWERSTAHPVCDATVVAEQEGKTITFSPCYNAFLGEGTWTVSATKDGYQRAAGSVIIPHGHSCSQPTYHSVELTLLKNDEGARATELRPSNPAAPPPAIETPPPGTPPTPAPSSETTPTTGPLPLQGRPSSGEGTPAEAAPPPITGAPVGPVAPTAPPPTPTSAPSPTPSGQPAPPARAFPLPSKAN
jgi:hypothetical protein